MTRSFDRFDLSMDNPKSFFHYRWKTICDRWLIFVLSIFAVTGVASWFKVATTEDISNLFIAIGKTLIGLFLVVAALVVIYAIWNWLTGDDL